jgi:hypothetical protein
MIERPSVFLVAGKKDTSRGQINIIVTDIIDVIDLAEEQGYEPNKVVNINKARRCRRRKKVA